MPWAGMTNMHGAIGSAVMSLFISSITDCGDNENMGCCHDAGTAEKRGTSIFAQYKIYHDMNDFIQ